VARRGFHISREYSTDPLEILFAREVMRTNLVALPADATVEELRHTVVKDVTPHGQQLYPVIDGDKRVRGVVTRRELHELTSSRAPDASLGDVVREPLVAWPDEPLRVVVFRMAETGLTRLPVVERESGKLVGMISLHDLLSARVRNLNEERHRERVLKLRLPFGRRPEPEMT
jgi:chloride channel protein, CIC family